MKPHLIKIICVISLGLLVGLYYLISNFLSNRKGKRILNKISANSEYATILSKSLDMLYYKEDLNKQIIEKVGSLNIYNQFDYHTILLLHRIDIDNFLIVTKTKDFDANFTLTGQIGEVKKIIQLNYKLTFDRVNNQLKLYSDYYTDRTDKAIRENFGRKLLNYLLE
jgi:hypothetical protein